VRGSASRKASTQVGPEVEDCEQEVKQEVTVLEQEVTVLEQEVKQEVRLPEQEVKQEVTRGEQEVSPDVARVLHAANGAPRKASELMEAVGLRNDYRAFLRHVAPLVEAGLLAMTSPDRPRSRSQRYQITDAGREVLSRA
jgi:hypothetical protein